MRKKALPRGFGLWPIKLAISWLKANGYENEAKEIEDDKSMKRNRYRALTIAQTKQALDAGFVIMAADGDIFFRDGSKMVRDTGLHSSAVHRSAFYNLQKKGYIKLDKEASKLAPEHMMYTLTRNQGYFAIWVKV